MSLRSRIVWAVTAVFASVALLTGWLVLNRVEASLRTAFDRALQTRANWLLSMVSVDPVVLPLPTETERMQVIYQSYGRQRELFRSPGFPNLNGVKNTNYSTYRTAIVHSQDNSLPTGQVTLTLCAPDESLWQDIRRLRWVFGLGWLISLGMAFVGGYVVAGWLLKPIQRIVNRANVINNALSIDLIPLPESRDELYQLTDTLNQMLGRIRESAEQQRNFFGAAAHELRTPLAVMRTGLEVTLNSDQTDERTSRFLTSQLEDVSRLTRLLDEFLTLSRPDEGAQSVKQSLTDVPLLIEKCVELLSPTALDYDVTIQSTSPDEPIKPLFLDAHKLEQVFMNLLENAVKYAVSGTVVVIQWPQNQPYTIQIQNQTVRESGPTLDLLQPYFRADPLREGHGLGLWISHRLTALVGGTLQLTWHQFTFTSTLTLPFARQSPESHNP